MWVRSLSLPPPHPLVLTGKGRSFLQPKLPPLPLRPFSSLCVCFMFPILLKKWGSLLLSRQVFFLWWLVAFFVRFFGLVQFFGRGGDSTQLHFLYRHYLLVYCYFLQSSAWCCASVTLVMGILMAPTVQHTLTQVLLLHSFCMNVPLT